MITWMLISVRSDRSATALELAVAHSMPVPWQRACTTIATVAMSCALAIALAGCSNDPQRALDRVKAYRAKGDNTAAAIEVRNALKDHPRNGAVLLLAGQLLADTGDLPNAENSLRRALEFGHPRLEVLPALGRVLLELEKYPEALEALKTDAKPDLATAPELMVLRGRAYLGQGALLEARTEFHVSQNMRPSGPAKLGLAQVALAENDPATAERLIAEVLHADPRDADALLLKAEYLRLGGRLDEAADTYQQGIKVAPGNAAMIAGLATLELARDRVDFAQPLVQQAQKLSPQGPRVRYAKAFLAYKQRRNTEAIVELGSLLESVPNNAPGLLLMGMAQFAQGSYDRAQIAFVDYLKRFPGNVGARRMLAATLLAKGQPHLAANVLAPIVKSTQDAGVISVAAEAYRVTGRFNESRALLQRGLKLAPGNADLHLGLALTDLESGARQRGITGLEAAIALGPADSRADEALIMVLLGQKDIDQAEKVAAALEKRLPDLAASYVLRGAVMLSKKDLAGARENLERALRLDPLNLQAVEALSDVDSAEQRPDRRRERIEAVLKRDGKHIGALLALARLDLAQGRHAQGVSTIRRTLAEHPESANALLLLADTQFRFGQTAEAVISARQAHELHPFDARAIAVLGEAQLAAGDKQAAIATLGKLITLQPAVVSGYLRLAAAQIAAGDTKTAAASVLNALEKAPQDRGARALLADIYLMAGDLDRAQALGAQIQKEDAGDMLGFRIEGDVQLARKEYARALDAYRKAAALQVNGALLVRIHQAQSGGRVGGASDGALRAWIQKNPGDVDTRIYLADVLSHAGRHSEAADEYRQVLRRTPNSARALNNLAWALHSAGDKRALDYARQAVQLSPRSAAAVDTLGWILVEQGNMEEGLPALLKAVGLDGENPEIRFHLVQALLKIGDNQRAKAELRALLGSKKPFPQVAEARALAGRLGL